MTQTRTQTSDEWKAGMIAWSREAEAECWARANRAETASERQAWVAGAAAAWNKRQEMENAR